MNGIWASKSVMEVLFSLCKGMMGAFVILIHLSEFYGTFPPAADIYKNKNQ